MSNPSQFRSRALPVPWASILATSVLLLHGTSRTALGQGQPSWGGTPVVQPVMPPDSRGSSQAAFNNLAWQQFITLNWAANPQSPGTANTNVPASEFGEPGDTSPVVWETFKEASEVFRTNAEPPTPWGASRALPAALARLPMGGMLKATSPFGIKGLLTTSKFSGDPLSDLSEIMEASGAWLTAQPRMNNNLTLFEKRMNEDEFNYIVSNKLYNAANQTPFALTNGINLPDGSMAFQSYGTVGSIEIKAAWIQLDDPTLWPLFKISKAYVSYPTTNGSTPPRLATVGLVGLHIIRKTPNAQQFAWSTFEHVYNAPSTSDIQSKTLKPWYTYYNLNCDPATDYYGCQSNRPPVPGKDPYNAPVQVVRTTPISTNTTDNIAGINSSVWKTIAASNPNSVFLNYQLINVLWPNANTPIGAGQLAPLPPGNFQPPTNQLYVANTVLETYVQNSLSCLQCHVFGGVAATSGTNSSLASDYSFLFGAAQTPPQDIGAPNPRPLRPRPGE